MNIKPNQYGSSAAVTFGCKCLSCISAMESSEVSLEDKGSLCFGQDNQT